MEIDKISPQCAQIKHGAKHTAAINEFRRHSEYKLIAKL